MKVLVIEDDFEHMRIVRRGLDDAGFVCDVAKTGAEGRDMLANGGCDVAILDRMLPDVDGLDVLREIRGRGISTPVIILSALGSTDERVRGLSAGADDYLAKPFSVD
jgi:two-component system OmpR family response regulator